MRRRSLSPFSILHSPFCLLGLALVMRIVTALPVGQPGYADAYYYTVNAERLYDGHGLTEPFVWNYLDPPAALPAPSHRYWRPLTSILAWLGMVALGRSFRAAQAPFVLMSAGLVLVSWWVAHDLSLAAGGTSAGTMLRQEHQGRRHATLAALLTVFCGFYALYLVVPDTFAPFALAGGLGLWAAGRGWAGGGVRWFVLAGVMAGLAHLTRADGLLLLAVALVAALATPPRAANLGVTLGTYALVMAPWLLHTWLAMGSPFSGGGLRTLFLRDYDQMFSLHADLDLSAFLAWGWGPILRSRLEAVWLVLQRLLVENLLVFLAPLAAVGLWRFRGERRLWPFFLYAAGLLATMTLAFPLPGVRGGFFHSAGALLPGLFAAVGPGLDVTIGWVARQRRGWHAPAARRVFSVALVVLAVGFTALVTARTAAGWNGRDAVYQEIGEWIVEQGQAGAVVMVGNPPGFTYHTGLSAVAVPSDGPESLLEAAKQYGARYLVLDGTRPRWTDPLLAGEPPPPGLARLADFGGGAVVLFSILPPGP